MLDAWTKFFDRRNMLGRSVSLVVRKMVGRIQDAKFAHERIARDLGNDACSGDAGDLAITFHDAFFVFMDMNGVSVDENGIDALGFRSRLDITLARFESPAHSHTQRCGHTARIDLIWLNMDDADPEGHLLDSVCKLFTPLGRKLLGIVYADDLRVIWQGYGGNRQWARKRATPDFIQADDDSLSGNFAHTRIELRSMFHAELFSLLFGEAY